MHSGRASRSMSSPSSNGRDAPMATEATEYAVHGHGMGHGSPNAVPTVDSSDGGAPGAAAFCDHITDALTSGKPSVALPTDQSDGQLLLLLHAIKALTLSPATLRALASRLNELASNVESNNSFTAMVPPVPALPVVPSVQLADTVAAVEVQSCSSAEASDATATARPVDASRVRGVITRWICEGYGFVVHDGRTIFLHEDEFDSSVPKRAGRSTALPPGEGPKAGDHVEFDVATNTKGFYGRNIRIVFVADIADCTQELVVRKPRGKPKKTELTGSSSDAAALTLLAVEGMDEPGLEATFAKHQRSSNDKRRAFERARKEQGKHPTLLGDWHCPKCKFLVFASKDVCPKCAHAKGSRMP